MKILHILKHILQILKLDPILNLKSLTDFKPKITDFKPRQILVFDLSQEQIIIFEYCGGAQIAVILHPQKGKKINDYVFRKKNYAVSLGQSGFL